MEPTGENVDCAALVQMYLGPAEGYRGIQRAMGMGEDSRIWETRKSDNLFEQSHLAKKYISKTIVTKKLSQPSKTLDSPRFFEDFPCESWDFVGVSQFRELRSSIPEAQEAVEAGADHRKSDLKI